MRQAWIARMLGLLTIIVLATGCGAAVAPAPTAGPQSAANSPNTPLTRDEIIAALKAEGQTVRLKSWGFGGLDKDAFPQRFKEYTEREYGVPVDLVWDPQDAVLKQHELAGTPISESIDLLDKEEDYYPKAREFDWIEPINQPRYSSVLTNWDRVEDDYIVDDGMGVIYQGFEWLGIAVRKDIVDPAAIQDWTDLAKPEFKGKIISYPLNEYRGQLIFVGILNSLIEQGIVEGELWSEEAYIEGLKWYKANIEPNVLKYVDTDEIRTMMQSGEGAIALTWGVYVRELQGAEWNLRDDVIAPVYPASGMAADRETLMIPRDNQRPVTARVLLNWMLSPEFLMVGWYKDEAGVEQNRWGMTERQFLVAYAGGINAEDRTLIPDWARPYYPEDPASLAIPVNFPFFAAHVEWAWEQYQQL